MALPPLASDVYGGSPSCCNSETPLTSKIYLPLKCTPFCSLMGHARWPLSLLTCVPKLQRRLGWGCWERLQPPPSPTQWAAFGRGPV